MSKRVVDILKKHREAIDDLVQVGLIDARVQTMTDIYTARRVVGLPQKTTAKAFKCSQRTVSRYITILETEL